MRRNKHCQTPYDTEWRGRYEAEDEEEQKKNEEKEKKEQRVTGEIIHVIRLLRKRRQRDFDQRPNEATKKEFKNYGKKKKTMDE